MPRKKVVSEPIDAAPASVTEYREAPPLSEIESWLHAHDRVTSPFAKCRWCGGDFVRVYEMQWLCENVVCAQRQIAHAMAAPASHKLSASPWLYLPTPFGVEMHEANEPNVLGGGAAGGAKSHTCRWDLYAWCLKIPNYESLLLRRTFPELESTHLAKMQQEQYMIPGARLANRVMYFANGSFVKAGHCESTKDMSKYLSTEYDDIRFEEASTFEPKTIEEISSRARSSKPAVIARGGAWVRHYSNPGNVGAVYLREHFIDKAPDADEYPDYDPKEYAFIRARVSDNPYLDPNYIKRLKGMRPARRRQLLDGDWDTFEGQFFGRWAPTKDGKPWHVRSIPAAELVDAPTIGACVWGYNRPGCFLWARILPYGRIYIQDAMNYQQSPIATVAAQIVARTQALELSLRGTYAPSEMFPPTDRAQHGVTVESPSQVFGRCGISLTSTSGDAAHGWQRVHDFLRTAPDGQPWLVVDPTCTPITRTLPTLLQSESDPDECEGEDYAARAIRALVSSRPAPHAKSTAPTPFPYGTVGWLKQQDHTDRLPKVRRIGR